MNIPEGWPTEEMVAAARGIPQIGHSSYYWRQVILNVLAAAPTPPAQEQDEPVAWMDVHNNWDLYKNKPSQVDVIPLYTRPDNSELRKVAEELISTFDRIKCLESRYGPCPAIEDLRAALEERHE